MIKETAPAKFNRFLSVIGRRDDGFHTLELVTTVLQWPSLRDELTVESAPDFFLEVGGPTSHGIETNDSNLVAKAWRLLERESGRRLPARVTLHKRIPHGAGLGGGSSDAAAALRAGNDLHGLGMSVSQQLSLAAELGSDVPLFLLGGTVLGLDKGQRVFPMRDLPLPPMLIAHPDIYVSTASVYKTLRQKDLYDSRRCPSLGENEPPPWRNDLTEAALAVCPELGQVRDALADVGGDPLLCGSGSCWAARFTDLAHRGSALEALRRRHPGWRFYTEEPPSELGSHLQNR